MREKKDGKALKIYADAGANVDFKNQMVRIPPDLVKKSMAGAPRHYTLPGRDRPELDVKLDGQSGTHFNNGGWKELKRIIQAAEGELSSH